MEGTGPRVSFRVHPLLRAVALVPLLVAIGLTIGTFVSGLGTDGPPLTLVLLIFLATVVVGWWTLWKTSYQLELDGGIVRWRSVVHGGWANVSEIVSVAPYPLSPTFQAIRFPTVNVVVWDWKGLSEFNRALARERPGLPIVEGPYHRFVEAFPGKSGFIGS
jgi:hypothetical protein